MLTVLAIWAVGFGGFTVFVDPYNILDLPGIEGFNARKTRAHEDGYRVRVGHRLLTTNAGTIIIGSSRVADGFPRDLPDWDGGWENLGMAGTTAYELARASTLVASNDNVNCVIFGVDLREFGPSPNTASTYWITPLSGDPRWVSMVKMALSPHPFARALQTVIDNVTGGSDVKWENAYREDGLRDRFEEEILKRYRYYASYSYDPERVAFLFRGIDALLATGKQVRVFIHPVHVWQEEAGRHTGSGPAEVALRRDIVAQLNERNALADADNACFEGPALEVWDFGGFHDVALTAPPTADGLTPNPWYYVPAHYRPALGAAVLDRMNGADPAMPVVDDRFGRPLNADTLETILVDMDARRDAWLASDDPWMTHVTDAFAAMDLDPPAPENETQVFLTDVDRRELDQRVRRFEDR